MRIRQVDAFFYGLFMDVDALRQSGVIAQPFEGSSTPALCYNLLRAPEPHERNPDYARRLKDVLTKLGFPEDYIASIE